MEARKAFLDDYQNQVLNSLVLPAELGARYRPVSCLKDGERKVYLVYDRGDQPAVLKIQPVGRADSLRQEYALLHRLHHPQIPRPLDYLEADGLEYLVREYVEGVSLYERVTSQGPLTPAQTRAAAISLCRVLHDLHNQNPPIICRDVKPQNVVMDPSGSCHLIDLGAARYYRREQTSDTVFLGTEATAPPEQFGYQQTDQRSDLYSLGVLLRFLLSGSFDPLPNLPGQRALCRVIRRCTAFDPKDRYPSAQAVLRVLERQRLRPAAIAAGGAACVALLACVLWLNPGRTVEASPLLEAALRQELGLEDHAPIPESRLQEVKQLLVCGEVLVGTLREHEEMAGSAHDLYAVETVHGEIDDQDLAVLAQCSNLRVLILDYQQITDLSPLSGLPLEYLSLTGNEISDLAPLADCRQLQTVDVGENPVRSADLLARLPEVREVGLEATGVTSVEAFAGSGIEFLNVRTTWVTDYTPLEECPQLTRLITGSMPEGAAETLAGLTGLEELRLYSTPRLDLALFSELQNLREVDFFGSSVSHPEALTGLSSLCNVNLGGTGLRDLTFLPSMQALTDLDLRDNFLSDLTPLLECPWLNLVVLSPRHQELADEQLAQAPFEIVFR